METGWRKHIALVGFHPTAQRRVYGIYTDVWRRIPGIAGHRVNSVRSALVSPQDQVTLVPVLLVDLGIKANANRVFLFTLSEMKA